MIQVTQFGTDKMKIAVAECYIHKKGTDQYRTSYILMPGETLDLYEEVATKPPYTKAQYDDKVAELVRQRYSESEEFALQRKAINAAFAPATLDAEGNNYAAALDEFATYNTYVEDCKQRALDPALYAIPIVSPEPVDPE